MFRIVGLFFVFMFIVVAFLGAGFVKDAYLTSPEKDAQEVEFIVEKGTSVKTIARRLEEEGIIDSAFFFEGFVWLKKNQADLQAGSFTLKPGMSFPTLMSELMHAKSIDIEVTIPEGFTLAQIEEVDVEKFKNVNKESWESVVSANGMNQLPFEDLFDGVPNGQNLEGYLFPDTYRFSENATAEVIVETMIRTLRRRLAEKNVVIPDSLIFENEMFFHEVLTLASIIEREVRHPEDMAIVSGIFQNRLEIGMALQADSTVNYITGKDEPAISLEDTKLDSPYNTYQRVGLPPGPISNPGMNSILAVLHPDLTESLYFLTTPEGEVIYAQTFDQHVKNKYKYLK